MKNLVDKIKGSLRTAAVAGAVSLAALSYSPKAASATTLDHSEDWTSWSQVYNEGSLAELVSNNGDFYVDGNLGKGILCGAGLLKNGRVIGNWNNNAYGLAYGEWFAGSVNVDPTTDVPANNYNALVVGERNDGMWGTIDTNGDGKWGTLDFYDNGTITVNAEIGELIMNPQGIIVNGVRGDFSSLPAYLGSVDHMENAGTFPKIEFDSSYTMVPEPITLALLGFGVSALALGKRKRKFVESKVVDKK